MKKSILCIIGESGTGKTLVADYITRNYNIPTIQSHTDRPLRNPNETGHTFHTKESFDKINKKDMIAFTIYGGYRYCATKQDLLEHNVYVIDEPGLDMLFANHQHEFNIKSLRILRNHINIDAGRYKRNLNTYTKLLSEFDYVIENNGTITDLEYKIDKLMLKYLHNKLT